MSNFIDVTSNIVNFNADGELLGAGDTIYVDFGVRVEGLSSGSTSSLWDGIQASQTSGAGITATIEGMVAGSFDGISVDSVGGSAITIGSGGSVISTAVAGGYGINLGDGANQILNDGQITGANGGIHILGDGTNLIVNNGTIGSNLGHAISVTGFSNTIDNTGILNSSGFAAIEVDPDSSGGSGANDISNSGQIAGQAGIRVYGATSATDFIDNSGTIQSDIAIFESGTGSLLVSNSGNISARDAGVFFNSSTGHDEFINTGVLQASTNDAVAENGGGGLIVRNNGSITSGTDAILAGHGDNHIQNSIGGVISAGLVGILLGDGSNRVVNHGEISGQDSALTILSAASGQGSNTMLNSGTLSSDAGYGFQVFGGDNAITNSGKIAGGALGVDIEPGTSHGDNALVNSGTIEGGIAVSIDDVAGDIDIVQNHGTIQGSALSGDAGIAETGHGALRIANDGTISGCDGIVFNGAGDTLSNSGTIGGSNVAIVEQGTGSLFVTNSGHIAGDIDFGNGAGTYNGIDGTLDGAVNGGIGADTIKGGADGETLNGGGGSDSIKGGIGDDTIDGGLGADKLVGGGGNDTFVYTGVADSKGVGTHDTIVGFDALADTFHFDVAVIGVDNAITAGTLDKAAFNTDLQTILTATALHAHHAVLFTASAGDLAGHTFLAVDDNGTAGYQAASDYLIELTGAAHLANLSVDNFI